MQNITRHGSVAKILDDLGDCLELVPMDSHFNNVSVGLYVKNSLCTVWTFSHAEGAVDRMRVIRDQMVELGGVSPLKDTNDRFEFACGVLHVRPLKFLLAQAVRRSPDYAHPTGDMSIKDSKSSMVLRVASGESDGRCVYQVAGEGEARNPAVRLRMIVAGFVRYGEMEKVGETEVAFECGQRHDELVRLLLPYSRNISAVEGAAEAESLRGQMTTNTLGFTPT